MRLLFSLRCVWLIGQSQLGHRTQTVDIVAIHLLTHPQYRTFYPLMTLTSAAEYAQIVDSYIDGWRKEGWLPETRANNLPGWTQG